MCESNVSARASLPKFNLFVSRGILEVSGASFRRFVGGGPSLSLDARVLESSTLRGVLVPFSDGALEGGVGYGFMKPGLGDLRSGVGGHEERGLEQIEEEAMVEGRGAANKGRLGTRSN